MANIAAIFHWPLSEMDGMSLEELSDWNDHAVARSGSMGG
ncbi:GpE family phage tail protein [Methylobacillus glycogenes]|nr:GpE family phage tail protein [Methylobacillus glycogenes]